MKDRRTFLKSVGAGLATVASGSLTGQGPQPPAGRPWRRPNIVLIVSDEHQAMTCGCYGSKVRRVDGLSPTPHIDALAREGVRFDAMYCPSPLCAPSRAAYMTGCYPHTTTAIHHKMQNREAGLSRLPGVRESIPAMGTYFRSAGYRTAAFGKMHVHGELADGWDLGFEERGLRFYTSAPGMEYADIKNGDVNRRYREMAPYQDARYRDIDPVRFEHAPPDLTVKENGVNQHFLETLVEREEEMIDSLVTDRSIDFIQRQALAGRPFLIHVGLEKPHRPWTVHQRFLDRFDPSQMPLPETIAEWVGKGMHPFVQEWCHSGVKGDAARKSIAAYYACAAQIDDCVGRIMDRCRELDILDNTIIIYTSDHGESLYEHGLIEKHNMLEPSVRVPFVMRAPWVMPQGTLCDSPSSLIDLIPTFCEVAGVPGAAVLEGASLLPAIAGKAEPERLVFSEFYQSGSCTRKEAFLPVRMGLNRRFKYVYTHAAADQLYVRGTSDDATGHNRAFDPAHEAMVSHLRLCTLDGWELDEYPMLDATVRVADGAVHLSWEAAATGARYDIYRSAGEDPRGATRLAAGLGECSWSDASAVSGASYVYWVLGHYPLDQPYVDPRGKARFGAQPIMCRTYPYSLPVSPRIKVVCAEGFQQTFAYKPLLGIDLGGLPWITIGMTPVPIGQEAARLTGPITVLSPKAIDGPGALSADMRTLATGPKPRDVLHLLFGYRNMRQFYALCLQKDQTLVLIKQTGEKSVERLASVKVEGARFDSWNRLEAAWNRGSLEARLNGKLLISVTDSSPYLGGRCGFDLPLGAALAEVRDPSLSHAPPA